MKQETAFEIVKEMLSSVHRDDVDLVGDNLAAAKKSLQAFYNTEGGIIIFGITKDRNFCRSIHANEIIENLTSFQERLNESEPLNWLKIEYQRHTVLLLIVERLPLAKLPCHLDRDFDSASLYRYKDENTIMPYWYLHALKTQKGESVEEQNVVTKFRAKYDDPDLFSSFCEEYKKKNSVIDGMSEGQIMDYLGLRKGMSRTLAYVLCFCIYPQMYFPNLVINLYDTTSGRKVFVESFDGTISAMWQKAVSKLKKMTGYQMKLVDGNVIKEGTYPIEVLGELVFNSLVHRDYSSFSVGDPIKLYINKDSFIIENPGQLFTNNDSVLVETKFERNPFLKKVNGFILSDQRNIHGLTMVENICQLRGFSSPIVESKDGYFKVQICRRDSLGVYHGRITIENICLFCKEPKSKVEIFHEFSHKKESTDYIYFYDKFIKPLLDIGVLKLTIPEKPKSKFQKIYTDEKYSDSL
jgi:ATP-dependent DNA helicase RecG